LAESSKVLQRPSADIIPAADKVTFNNGESVRLTPPLSARSQSLARSAVHAKWMADSDEEQAVSTAMQGPCRPST